MKLLDLKERKIEKVINLQTARPLVARWLPRKGELVAIGCFNGSIIFYNIETNQQKKVQRADKLPVEDLAWYKGEDYLMASFSDGALALYDVESEEEKQSYERQGAGTKSIAWIDNMSGDFITSTDKVGALRIWNVAQKAPKAMAKVGVTGVNHMLPFKGDASRYLISFKNGAVGVYNIETWKLEFSTEAGHAETIFDLRFKPGDKNQLATCSYDGTIRLWDARTMRLLSNIVTDKAQPGEKV